MMARFAIVVFLLAGVSLGYQGYQHLTSHGLSAQTIAENVGGTYGDMHPRIVRAISTETDQQQPMYIITVTGHFVNRNKTARYLEFSALANGLSIGPLWAGKEYPSRGAHRSWFVDHVILGGQA